MTTSVPLRAPSEEASLQAHYYAPPAPATVRTEPSSSPSLEGIRHNSRAPPEIHCDRGRWLLSVCVEHGNERWIYRPCKRRDCPVCGVKRRKKVAWRIASGIEQLGGEHGAGWFVGTWRKDVTKKDAVKAVARFVARIRRNFRHRIEYACTWELTKRPRLHVNLIFAPWTYTHSTILARWWQDVGGGPNVWIKRVGAGVGQEAAKSREDAGDYFCKWEQMVPTGRAANYSRGWPKLPGSANPTRQGETYILRKEERSHWQLPPAFDRNDIQLTLWRETRPNEFQARGDPMCQCFNPVIPQDAASVRSPP